MYKYTLPIHLNVLNDETLPELLAMAENAGIHRILLCDTDHVFSEASVFRVREDFIRRALKAFHDASFETGIWISAFGHGVPLNCDRERKTDYPFTVMEGVAGDAFGYAYCPSDKAFTEAYAEGVKHLASLAPDMILLDDDFRINCRRYRFGCFCKNHLAAFRKEVGEDVKRENIQNLVFSGGANKYRDAWMKIMGKTLEDFASSLRKALDEVAPHIRLGFCTSGEVWDMDGADALHLAQLFAGGTKPFLRTCGAPYWSKDRLSKVIDDTRMQSFWCRKYAPYVETAAEGDVYPRPRYTCASAYLELFDLALLCDGSVDGDLKYMSDYNQPPTYETGYFERHEKNAALRRDLAAIFAGKTPVGVRVASPMHTFKDTVFPTEVDPDLPRAAESLSTSQVQRLLSDNAVPTTFDESDAPLFVAGARAAYIGKEDLRHGAILDVPAALMLAEKGIDTGLLSAVEREFEAERYAGHDDAVYGVSRDEVRRTQSAGLYEITVKDGAKVLSRFLPSETPSAYLYENAEGMRFYVPAYDAYRFGGENFLCNYYRGPQIAHAYAYLAGKPLPAVCHGQPNLYLLASEGKDGALAVALFNVFPDESLHPTITLQKPYKHIRFVNCSGTLCGDTVTLTAIPAYGACAIELSDREETV